MHKTQNRYPTCTCTIFAFLQKKKENQIIIQISFLQKRKKEIKYTYVYNISEFLQKYAYMSCVVQRKKKKVQEIGFVATKMVGTLMV